MERWRDEVAALPGVAAAAFAVSEEGVPSVRDALRALGDAGDTPIVIVPMLLPAEANSVTWIRRAVQRWKATDSHSWPDIRIAPFPGEYPLMLELLAATIRSNDGQPHDTPQDGTDHIIRHHLPAGDIVEDLAYWPAGAKQRRRR